MFPPQRQRVQTHRKNAFAVGLIEILHREMSRDACHGKERLCLRVVEFIILDVWTPCSGLGNKLNLHPHEVGRTNERTVVNWPPERICDIALDIEGFSATHNTLMNMSS